MEESFTLCLKPNKVETLFFEIDHIFLGRGMHLNHWTPKFDPELDVPSTIHVCVYFPHLPLHCRNKYSLRSIGNKLGKYIDKSKSGKGMFACARICVEVDLEKGLPKDIMLTLDS